MFQGLRWWVLIFCSRFGNFYRKVKVFSSFITILSTVFLYDIRVVDFLFNSNQIVFLLLLLFNVDVVFIVWMDFCYHSKEDFINVILDGVEDFLRHAKRLQELNVALRFVSLEVSRSRITSKVYLDTFLVSGSWSSIMKIKDQNFSFLRFSLNYLIILHSLHIYCPKW